MSEDIRVADVMTRDVVTLRPDQSVAEAADVLAGRAIGAAPVVDGGRYVGLLSDDDLIVSEARLHLPTTFNILGGQFFLPGSQHRFEEELEKAVGATVGDVMDDDHATIGPDEPLMALATLMHDKGITHVPVVSDGEVLGIVARGDLIRHLSETT
ncbi:MAG: CBS domain-containing protein [Acidimicrobiia bacterium]